MSVPLSRAALRDATMQLYASLLDTASRMVASGELRPREVAALLSASGRYGIGAENVTHHTVTPLLPAAQRDARLRMLLGAGDVTPTDATRYDTPALTPGPGGGEG